jgi:hypothetical protein
MAQVLREQLEVDGDMEPRGAMRRWRAVSRIPGIKILNEQQQ